MLTKTPKAVPASAIKHAAERERARAKWEHRLSIARHRHAPGDPRLAYKLAKSALQLLSHRTLGRDVELADFIDKRMPPDRKREGIPKSLLYDAKDKFGLSSKSSVLRAYKRGKKWKSDAAKIGFENGEMQP
jgi:hypothetical protein